MRLAVLIALAAGSAWQCFGQKVFETSTRSLHIRSAYPAQHPSGGGKGRSSYKDSVPVPIGWSSKTKSGIQPPSPKSSTGQKGSSKNVQQAPTRSGSPQPAAVAGRSTIDKPKKYAGLSPDEKYAKQRAEARETYRRRKEDLGLGPVREYGSVSALRMQKGKQGRKPLTDISHEQPAAAAAAVQPDIPKPASPGRTRALGEAQKSNPLPRQQQPAGGRQRAYQPPPQQQPQARLNAAEVQHGYQVLQQAAQIHVEEQRVHNTNGMKELHDVWKNTGSADELINLPQGERADYN